MKKKALLKTVIKPFFKTVVKPFFSFKPIAPGNANAFMTQKAWDATRGQGIIGTAKRVGSEVAEGFRPVKPQGALGWTLAAGLPAMQAAGTIGSEIDRFNKVSSRQETDMSAKSVLHSYLRKQASSAGDIAGQAGKALLIGAGLAAGGAAIGKGVNAVGDMFTRLQAKRMFEELQRRHPEVKSNPKARQYFDLTVAYAPSLLRHPNAVGDFLIRQLQYPMSSVEFIKQLADLEATISKTQRSGSSIGEQAAAFGSRRDLHEMIRPRS